MEDCKSLSVGIETLYKLQYVWKRQRYFPSPFRTPWKDCFLVNSGMSPFCLLTTQGTKEQNQPLSLFHIID